MGTPRNIGVLWAGQSNQQGATCTDNGGVVSTFVSAYAGFTDPVRGNANTGGSVWPLLYDLGLKRGVRYLPINGGIGGASITHFTGTAGATVTGGSAATPAANMNMSGVGLTGGTGVPCNEGDTGFDIFGLLSRIVSIKAQYPQITEWISCWSNAESDGGQSSANYALAQISVANYFLAHGSNCHFIGLSSSGANSVSNMDTLSAGVTSAISTLQRQGKNVKKGGDLYVRFGMTPPLYPERTAPGTSVHLVLEGQRVNAQLWDSVFSAAGY